MVLVPRCSKLNGVGASGTLSLPSAAFVLKIGTRISAGKGSTGTSVSASDVHSQVIVPTGSAAAAIVVPPCHPSSGSGKGNAVVVGPPAGGSDTSLAPRC